MAGRVLRDHKWERKRAIPPLLSAGLNWSFSNWVRGTIPEIFWIGLLHEGLGLRAGAPSALALAQAAQDEVGEGSQLPPFCFARAFAGLDLAQQKGLVRRIGTMPDAKRAVEGLTALAITYPDYPLAYVTGGARDDNGFEAARKLNEVVLRDLFDRRSRKAMLVQATSVYIATETGRLRYPQAVGPPDLEALLHYPDTERSKMEAASVRATMNAILGIADEPSFIDAPDRWPDRFWENGLAISECR